MKSKLFFLLLFIGTSKLSAQEITTRKDSLKGGLRFERTCFDVLRYDLNIKINPDEKSIVGFNEISFKVLLNTTKIQLDLIHIITYSNITWNNIFL